MPRSKSSLPDEHGLLYVDIANLKNYCSDLLLDAKTIYATQLQKLGGWMTPDHVATMEERLQELSTLKFDPQHTTRVYIVTEADFFRLVMFGMDDCVVDYLDYKYGMPGDLDLSSANTYQYVDEIHPYYRSALYIFIGDKVSRYELSAGQLATLMAVFHNENLVDFSGTRDRFYGEPRRAHREKR